MAPGLFQAVEVDKKQAGKAGMPLAVVEGLLLVVVEDEDVLGCLVTVVVVAE